MFPDWSHLAQVSVFQSHGDVHGILFVRRVTGRTLQTLWLRIYSKCLGKKARNWVFILSKDCDMVTFIFLSITSVVGKSLNISDLSRDSGKKAIFKEPELGTFPQPFLNLQKSRFLLPPPQSSLNPCSSTLLLSVSAKWWCSTRSWHGWKPRVLLNVCPIDFVNVTS